MSTSKTTLEISTGTILKIALLAIGLWLLTKIIGIVILFFIVLVITAALSPIVEKWSAKMPRILAVILLYLVLLVIIAGALALLLPPLIDQLSKLSGQLPSYFQSITPFFESLKQAISLSSQTLNTVAAQLQNLGTNLFKTTIGFFSGIVALITIIVLSFYLLLEEQALRQFIYSLMPPDKRQATIDLILKINKKMGGWLRGQVILALVVGSLTLIGLLILRVPFPLALAIWVAITELIPYVGPILGAIPAVIIAFFISPITGILTLVLFAVVQQLEAQFLVPKIMQKAVGLSPVVIILALLIGAKLLGILGAILAIPAAAALQVIIQEWPKFKKVS